MKDVTAKSKSRKGKPKFKVGQVVVKGDQLIRIDKIKWNAEGGWWNYHDIKSGPLCWEWEMELRPLRRTDKERLLRGESSGGVS